MKNKSNVIDIKPPAQLMKSKDRFDIFLAGSIENGKAEDWQEAFKKELEKTVKKPIGIFNPRRENWDPTWKEGSPELEAQIEWEIEHLEQANLIVMYLQPGTISPISLFELGLFCKDVYAMRKRMIVLCPSGFHRKTNVDVYCMHYDIMTAKNMKDLIKKTQKEIKDWDPKHEEKFEEATKKLGAVMSKIQKENKKTKKKK